MKDPLKIEVTRGQSVESQHLVDAVIMNADKKLIASHGDVTSGILPRSAIKMLQALLLVESGAHTSLGLDHRHLALACSSHHADHVHTDLVHDWLKKLDLDEEHLRCGPQSPSRESVRELLIRENLKPHRGHNNCSGKHSGILSVCLHKNYDTKNYDLYDHLVQQDMIKTLSEVYEYNLYNSPYGVDGCGIPTIAVPLFNLTVGHINLTKRDSGKQILEAIARAPEYISGDNNFCTEIVRKTNGHVFAKVGAEGVYTAFSPTQDIFISLKVRDGAGRASEFAIASLLKKYGCIHPNEEKSLEKFLYPKIKNLEGKIVGEIRRNA